MRRASIAFFLGDPAFLSDAKFRALARALPDSDDFNSAVGAFWIIVAACRRNGSPSIDAETETGSRHVPILREVGLLTDVGLPRGSFDAWAPMSPQQAAAGKARAEQADAAGLRDEKGQFVKAPSEPSDPSALDPLASVDQPSPPLPSSHVKENDVESLDGGEPEGPALTWLAQHGIAIRPGNGYHQALVLAVERHGVTALIRMFESLAVAGTPAGDIKGYVYAGIDALDAARRPRPAKVAKAAAETEDGERFRRGVERTRRDTAELRAAIADHDASRRSS